LDAALGGGTGILIKKFNLLVQRGILRDLNEEI
jgi:hypothetical protein